MLHLELERAKLYEEQKPEKLLLERLQSGAEMEFAIKDVRAEFTKRFRGKK